MRSDFTFIEEDTCTTKAIEMYEPEIVVHLASLAGVRNSIENIGDYARNNILSQINLLEQSRKIKIKKFIYASSSSVYGLNKNVPFKETDNINLQNSPYATSKLCIENYANLYQNLYKVQTIHRQSKKKNFNVFFDICMVPKTF